MKIVWTLIQWNLWRYFKLNFFRFAIFVRTGGRSGCVSVWIKWLNLYYFFLFGRRKRIIGGLGWFFFGIWWTIGESFSWKINPLEWWFMKCPINYLDRWICRTCYWLEFGRWLRVRSCSYYLACNKESFSLFQNLPLALKGFHLAKLLVSVSLSPIFDQWWVDLDQNFEQEYMSHW